MRVQLRDSDQKRLYIYNRSVLTPERYSELWAIEREWVVRRAAEHENRAPRFDYRIELIDALHDLLGKEQANPSDDERFIAEEATLDQFKVVVSEFAVDGLVESQSHIGIIRRLPSRSRMAILRVLIDEFGCGNDDMEHSHLYRTMLAELGMPGDLEHYVERAGDASFAYVNLFHWLADRAPAPEYFLGAYAYFEASVLYAFRPFAAAAGRLGIANDKYYTEHLYIDSFHSKQMQTAIRALGEHRDVDLAKVWAGVTLTSETIAEATEAAVSKARRAA
ncbi:iron-containing redox enzyme family protein [Microbispora sp. RL4-1S]|uniref:Iron-containing redox enzyme family protein n=1 Tax=Microbispora oryzae TaxID=2806554 RepID=A0A941AG59_9ACTN|nr:iron-containing redox enzyme family protein [Microbispora oryzae]MBP2702656.1 iron-containing redox enzyme family protein [Microbispora oryzae]